MVKDMNQYALLGLVVYKQMQVKGQAVASSGWLRSCMIEAMQLMVDGFCAICVGTAVDSGVPIRHYIRVKEGREECAFQLMCDHTRLIN